MGFKTVTAAAAGLLLTASALAEPLHQGQWDVEVTTSQLAGGTDYTASNTSANSVKNDIGRKRTASLVVQCKSGELNVFVDWPAFMGNYGTEVTWTFDQGQTAKQTWKPLGTGTGTVVPNPRDFLKDMAVAGKLVVDAPPYQFTSIEAVFYLSGADKVAHDVEAACPH